VLIRTVRRCHRPFAMGAIRFIRGKVRVDSFGYISVKLLQPQARE
jgi:hypothetical protein